MGETLILTGNYAAAHGARLARAQFIAAYPITPQTTIVEKLAEFVETGKLNAKYLRVESEHSAMAAVIGASATGLRVFTATASHGLAYMHEMVIWAAGARLPIVMAVVGRAFAPPWNIWNEHTDMLMERDTGWMIFLSENNQEVLDTVIQAYRIAEDERVLLPAIVGLDAFILSHTYMPVELPDQEVVDKFLPPRKPAPFLLDPENPITHGNVIYPDYYMEVRYHIHEYMEKAKEVIKEVDREWGWLTGRSYGGLIDCYKCEDADVIVASVGSSAGDAKTAADRLRERGYRAGVARIRAFRPFPREELIRIASRVKAVGVVDRNLSPSIGGILYNEVKAALYDMRNPPPVQGYIAGLGGRDITVNDYINIFLETYRMVEEGEKPTLRWVNLKEEVLPR